MMKNIHFDEVHPTVFFTATKITLFYSIYNNYHKIQKL